MPLVSVVISSHNAAPWITATLESVLKQTHAETEIIVVDDGSTDGTRDIVAGYARAVQLILVSLGSKSAGKNVGIQAAQGRYVAFLDADDLWLPDKLALQVALLESQPRLSWAYSDSFLFNDTTDQNLGTFGRLSRLYAGEVLRPLFLADFIPTLTVMVRRDVLLQVRGFDESLARHQPEDWDLWLRLAALAPVGVVQRPLARYRLHTASLMALETPTLALEGQLDIIERAVSRHPELAELRRQAVANACIGAGRVAARNGELRLARHMFGQAVRSMPRDLRGYGYWVTTMVGVNNLRKLIALRHFALGRSAPVDS